MFWFVPISIIQLTDELWTLSCTFKVGFKSTHCSSLRLPHLLAIDGVMPALGFVFTASVSRKMCNTDTPPTLSLQPVTAKRVSEASPCASHQEQICPPDSNRSPEQPPLKVKLQRASCWHTIHASVYRSTSERNLRRKRLESKIIAGWALSKSVSRHQYYLLTSGYDEGPVHQIYRHHSELQLRLRN